jgi:hypothetical protein
MAEVIRNLKDGISHPYIKYFLEKLDIRVGTKTHGVSIGKSSVE